MKWRGTTTQSIEAEGWRCREPHTDWLLRTSRSICRRFRLGARIEGQLLEAEFMLYEIAT